MKRKGIISILTLLLIAASIGSVLAFGDELFGGDSENRDKIVKAIEEKDYNTWKEVMSSQLTEEKFNQLVARHETMLERQAQREAIEQAIQEGDYEAWKEAMDNINSEMNPDEELTEEKFNLLVAKHETMLERQAQREAIEQAIQEGDYEAWKEAMDNINSEMNLDEDNFKILVQLYQARENKDYETVKELSEQLELPERFAEHGMFDGGRERMV